MQAIYSLASFRALEKDFAERPLMQLAGLAAFKKIQTLYPNARSMRVIAGPGNNGGDGTWLAYFAALQGWQVALRFVYAPKNLAPEIKAGVWDQALFTPEAALDQDILVDAIFGLGLDRPVEGSAKMAIDWINRQTIPIIALDLPSGLAAETGQVLGEAVSATHTVTFLGLKAGIVTGQGRNYSGEVHLEPLLSEAELASYPLTAWYYGQAEVQGLLPPRPPSGHKAEFGQVLVIGGAPGMSGAGKLAALGALRIGAGKVILATHPEHAHFQNLDHPELMTAAIATPEDLAPYLERASVIAIGPGLGRSLWGETLWASVLQVKRPLVVDADALFFLAKHQTPSQQWILTPHPGEAATLLQKATAEVEADRLHAAKQLQKRYGGVAVLKGGGSIVQSAEGSFICKEGTPYMASPGMGDFLTGILAGLLAQGLSLTAAALLGVAEHAAAAASVYEDEGRPVLAGDLEEYL